MSAHVYGPVPSRRLGRSLGVDVLPFKTCSFDCLYCQLGHTTNLTQERKAYVPTADVIAELRQALSGPDRPDFVSFAGSGEPTLHSGLGEMIRAIKAITDVPVAIFTNGSLLWMPEVQRDLADADVVIPSLDAGDPALLERVNHPVSGLAFSSIIDGLLGFRDVFRGRIWLEILLVGGISDDDAAVDRIAELSARIRPDRIQLNTVCRPPAESCALPVPAARLEAIRRHFAGIPAPVDIVADHITASPHPAATGIGADDVFGLVERHPATAAGVAAGLNIAEETAAHLLAELAAAGRVTPLPRDGQTYYAASTQQAAAETH